MEFPRGGRVEKMHQLSKSILSTNATEDKAKCEVLCIHGLSGIEKTYMLREMYLRKDDDIPMHLKSEEKKVTFLFLKLNRSACTELILLTLCR